jgi:hypothetical protein
LGLVPRDDTGSWFTSFTDAANHVHARSSLGLDHPRWVMRAQR